MEVVEGNITVPVKVGEARLAFKSRASCKSNWSLNVHHINHRSNAIPKPTSLTRSAL